MNTREKLLAWDARTGEPPVTAEEIAAMLLGREPAQTPGSAPQTGHSAAQTRRNQGGPGRREPTR